MISADSRETAYVCTPEDIILAKLDWYRRGHRVSDQQWRDISGVLRIQAGKLDLDYLRRTAEEFGLRDLLQRAIDESSTK